MKAKKTMKHATKPGLPLSLRLAKDTREKMQTIATRNGLSLTDVATLSLSAGMNIVESKLAEMTTPKAA